MGRAADRQLVSVRSSQLAPMTRNKDPAAPSAERMGSPPDRLVTSRSLVGPVWLAEGRARVPWARDMLFSVAPSELL